MCLLPPSYSPLPDPLFSRPVGNILYKYGAGKASKERSLDPTGLGAQTCQQHPHVTVVRHVDTLLMIVLRRRSPISGFPDLGAEFAH
jgi:hypothetical protein